MKKRTLRIIPKLLLLLFIACLVTGCQNNVSYQNTILKEYHSGDAKFFSNDTIITSKNGELYVIDLKNKKHTSLLIKSNWIDTLPNEKIIVYSNTENQTGICKIDNNNNVLLNSIILTDTTLHIDPSIIKINDTYFLTSTKIVGNINNSDPTVENGNYTVQLYRSSDLSNWEYLSDIVSYHCNIEDVDLFQDGDIMRFIFEKETLDKGTSEICIIDSSDNGKSWSNEKNLISNNADNEPATFFKNQDDYWLFYSNDKELPGKSYTGASAYLSKFDQNFNLISTQKLNTQCENNLLLYQVLVKDEKNLILLYSHDYLKNNDLYIENLDL